MSASQILNTIFVMEDLNDDSCKKRRGALMRLITRIQDKEGIPRPEKRAPKGTAKGKKRKRSPTKKKKQKVMVKKPIVLQPGQVYLQQRPDGTTVPITLGEDNTAYEMHYV